MNRMFLADDIEDFDEDNELFHADLSRFFPCLLGHARTRSAGDYVAKREADTLIDFDSRQKV